MLLLVAESVFFPKTVSINANNCAFADSPSFAPFFFFFHFTSLYSLFNFIFLPSVLFASISLDLEICLVRLNLVANIVFPSCVRSTQ